MMNRIYGIILAFSTISNNVYALSSDSNCTTGRIGNELGYYYTVCADSIIRNATNNSITVNFPYLNNDPGFPFKPTKKWAKFVCNTIAKELVDFESYEVTYAEMVDRNGGPDTFQYLPMSRVHQVTNRRALKESFPFAKRMKILGTVECN